MRVTAGDWLTLTDEQKLGLIGLAVIMNRAGRLKVGKPAKVGKGELSQKIIWISSKCIRSAHLEQRGEGI
ncbi:hypothetical protein [Lihuaxuella thermophila]|uniref:Uncharacterized protein n=1 Tax=Lihuaxuella thermophila TaxID=1173111 RepID=A0A1H8HB82_9BACL|nr:hypothetical protein [Lihuaxuella thermophila]SEN53179.1 hypothetical protein SAMN05444955_113115 [Lihuaxuella thermophila]